MKDFLRFHSTALLALACFLIGGLACWLWLQPGPSQATMSRQQVKATQQTVATAHAQAAERNAWGDTAAAYAELPYRAAKAAERHATLLHPRRHAPTPLPRAAADSVGYYTRVLTAY